jgi:hypothetical protein
MKFGLAQTNPGNLHISTWSKPVGLWALQEVCLSLRCRDFGLSPVSPSRRSQPAMHLFINESLPVWDLLDSADLK